jgi:hypothetical protein
VWVVHPINTLLRLTESNIHRTPFIDKGDMRTFVKVSISELHKRNEVRNHPTLKEVDFIKKE